MRLSHLCGTAASEADVRHPAGCFVITNRFRDAIALKGGQNDVDQGLTRFADHHGRHAGRVRSRQSEFVAAVGIEQRKGVSDSFSRDAHDVAVVYHDGCGSLRGVAELL